MHTARPLSSPAAPLLSLPDMSLVTRLGGLIKTFLTRRSQNLVSETASGSLPIVGRVATISSVGIMVSATTEAMSADSRAQPLPCEIAVASPSYAARRPGVQGRWKSTDRVAMY